MNDLREDPEFLRRVIAKLIQLAVQMERSGSKSLRNQLTSCVDEVHREIRQEKARIPAQGELFKGLYP